MTAAERLARTEAADALCFAAFRSAGCPDSGVALVAVGGYGRGELAPYSDLDLLLIHSDQTVVGDWASQLWYPLWDSGFAIDHAVRSLTEAATQAASDLRVALGLLDVRHLAGDRNVTLQLRTNFLTSWRRDARERLPELFQLGVDRQQRAGELAHLAIPDLKESAGGLRDAAVLKGLVAAWLVDVPHQELSSARTGLLDVRDALHDLAGRNTDRVAPEYWPELATKLGLADALDAQRRVRGLGRRLAHLDRLAWRRALSHDKKIAITPNGPKLTALAPGVARLADEAVLVDPKSSQSALLPLRLAVAAAENDLVLSSDTVRRSLALAGELTAPWPVAARELLVRLLAVGPALLPIWEALDEGGAIQAWIPEWAAVRLLPHASTVHQFTVDRHSVQACIEASKLVRRVNRPDLLLVSALLHDIGKGQLGEHCEVGAPIAQGIVKRLGFANLDVTVITNLVRWHLLLPTTATTRDVSDPATVAAVTSQIPDRRTFELLAALTEADARATSNKAWSSWRSGLILELYFAARAVLHDEPVVDLGSPELTVPARIFTNSEEFELLMEATDTGCRVTLISQDRLGLMADMAATLAWQRLPVLAARAWTEDGIAFSQWELAESVTSSLLRQHFESVALKRGEVASRLTRPVRSSLEPVVELLPEASDLATVIEVRAEDRPGLIFVVCQTLAALGFAVKSAHVATLGRQAVDVFYLQTAAGAPLTAAQGETATRAVTEALSEMVRLSDD